MHRAISAAGRSTWDTNRPFTLVVLSPPPTGPAAEVARRELDAAAEARGLPISLVPLPLVDAPGAELSRDALSAAAQQLGGDAVLVGRSDTKRRATAVAVDALHELHRAKLERRAYGRLNGAVDALARVPGCVRAAGRDGSAGEVDGVARSPDYAQVGRLLQGAPGVRSVDVVEATRHDGGLQRARARRRPGA